MPELESFWLPDAIYSHRLFYRRHGTYGAYLLKHTPKGGYEVGQTYEAKCHFKTYPINGETDVSFCAKHEAYTKRVCKEGPPGFNHLKACGCPVENTNWAGYPMPMCGFYGWKFDIPDDVIEETYDSMLSLYTNAHFGIVAFSGRVVEHEYGYRAEKMEILDIQENKLEIPVKNFLRTYRRRTTMEQLKSKLEQRRYKKERKRFLEHYSELIAEQGKLLF